MQDKKKNTKNQVLESRQSCICLLSIFVETLNFNMKQLISAMTLNVISTSVSSSACSILFVHTQYTVRQQANSSFYVMNVVLSHRNVNEPFESKTIHQQKSLKSIGQPKWCSQSKVMRPWKLSFFKNVDWNEFLFKKKKHLSKLFEQAAFYCVVAVRLDNSKVNFRLFCFLAYRR